MHCGIEGHSLDAPKIDSRTGGQYDHAKENYIVHTAEPVAFHAFLLHLSGQIHYRYYWHICRRFSAEVFSVSLLYDFFCLQIYNNAAGTEILNFYVFCVNKCAKWS